MINILIVFLVSLLIPMAQSQTTPDILTTDIKTSDLVHTSLTSAAIDGLTSFAPASTRKPSSSILPTTLIPSSKSAIVSTIPNSATTIFETTNIQGSTDKTTESNIESTELTSSKGRTTLDSQETTLNMETTSLKRTTTGSQITTPSGQSTQERTTPHPLVTTLSEQPHPSTHSNSTTINGKTTIAGTTTKTSKSLTTVQNPQSTEKVALSTTKVATEPPIKTTKPFLPIKTTEETKPTEIKGTASSSSSAREPLLSIPQWFAVFLGTFLTIFLIFLTNIWYKAKMTPDTTKPSIELIKNGEKNDRPKSWQENNVPLEFMSMHIELPKESKTEMKCAENLAFEGDKPDNAEASSFTNPSFEVVTLTKL
ncbi:uncharacterized protein [Antedon mediterranea]|uniref:uncharacterized protein isoform X2 n=1 Tax=Antedon mediterranea TaxID=105859 RepID=UPI003AF74800